MNTVIVISRPTADLIRGVLGMNFEKTEHARKISAGKRKQKEIVLNGSHAPNNEQFNKIWITDSCH